MSMFACVWGMMITESFMNYPKTDMFIVAIFLKRPDSALTLQALFLICTCSEFKHGFGNWVSETVASNYILQSAMLKCYSKPIFHFDPLSEY